MTYYMYTGPRSGTRDPGPGPGTRVGSRDPGRNPGQCWWDPGVEWDPDQRDPGQWDLGQHTAPE